MSILPVAIVTGVAYHLARQGCLTQTVWLGLNVLDTVRALKSTTATGRPIGTRSRRRALRSALLCSVVYVAFQQVGAIPDRIFAWLPLYSVVRAVLVAAFLLTRVSMSETLYTSFIQSTLKRYEAHIDLTLLLLHSIATLFFHFAVRYPLDAACAVVQPLLNRLPHPCFAPTLHANLETLVDQTASVIDMTFGSVDDDALIVSVADLPRPGGTEQVQAGSRTRVTALPESAPHGPRTPSLDATPGILEPTRVDVRTKRQAQSSHDKPPSARRLVVNRDISPAVPQDDRFKRSTAPTPTSIPVSQQTGPASVEHLGSSGSTASKRKAAMESGPPIVQRTKPVLKSVSNALSQPPRRLPTARDANVPAPTKSLQKSKSNVDLGSTKPPLISQTIVRPTKSAPTRRGPVVPGDASTTTTSAASRRIPSAAERARSMRNAKQKEEAISVGEKRKLVRAAGPEGSKRTRIHVAKDLER